MTFKLGSGIGRIGARRLRTLATLMGLVVAASALAPTTGYAATVFVYIDGGGNRLIANKRGAPAGYRLLRKYQADDYFGTAIRPGIGKIYLKPRASDFDNLILATSAKLGLEPALLKAIIHIESAFNPTAVSPKGAGGLMQLMPGTAERYGVTDRFNPNQALSGGGRYMRDLLLMFDHDTELALAAYNAGENAVTRYNGIPPYKETQNYVQLVIQMRDLYRKEPTGV